MRKKLNSKGFTLIELLIVIIIIGILAAIAFVAYSGAQNKAHKADAQSTLSEVRTKLGEYNASNGYYPANQSTFDTWMGTSDGGNNTTLAGKFVTPDYVYTATGCDSSGANCSGYTAVAKGHIWGGTDGTDDITVTN